MFLYKLYDSRNHVRIDYWERIYSYINCQQYTIQHLIEETKMNTDEENQHSLWYMYLVLLQLYLEQKLTILVFLKFLGGVNILMLFLNDIQQAVGNMIDKLFCQSSVTLNKLILILVQLQFQTTNSVYLQNDKIQSLS